MSDYQKGMLAIPSLILILGAVVFVLYLLILITIKFNSPTFIGPRKMFDKNDDINFKYMSNRVGNAVNFLYAESGWRVFWFGGWGAYVVRVPRDGLKTPTTEKQRKALQNLEQDVRREYQVYLKDVHGQEIY